MATPRRPPTRCTRAHGTSPFPPRAEIPDMPTETLRLLLDRLNMDTTGRRPELIARILSAIPEGDEHGPTPSTPTPSQTRASLAGTKTRVTRGMRVASRCTRASTAAVRRTAAHRTATRRNLACQRDHKPPMAAQQQQPLDVMGTASAVHHELSADTRGTASAAPQGGPTHARGTASAGPQGGLIHTRGTASAAPQGGPPHARGTARTAPQGGALPAIIPRHGLPAQETVATGTVHHRPGLALPNQSHHRITPGPSGLGTRDRFSSSAEAFSSPSPQPRRRPRRLPRYSSSSNTTSRSPSSTSGTEDARGTTADTTEGITSDTEVRAWSTAFPQWHTGSGNALQEVSMSTLTSCYPRLMHQL